MSSPTGTVPSCVPDSQVPSTRVQTGTGIHRANLRAARYLKGPIPLPWIRKHIRDAADRLLLVLLAHADMKKSDELKVTADVQRDAGIEDRKTLYRALKSLEATGTITVRRGKGARAVVRINRSGGPGP